MPELVPAPFAELLTRMHDEAALHGSVFALPRKKWYLPGAADGPDLSVRFHGQRAGNASGPAAGPHTQMAQNILLSYAGGGRIVELKTVQINDRLTISRPCIDITTIGYNVEWSQELRIEQSIREYVGGMMLVEIFRNYPELGGGALAGAAGDVIYDMSVGYDLEGIRSAKVQGFLDAMRDAGGVISDLRSQIPARFARDRDLPFRKTISSGVTLSTFHGCPAGEIERICEFLICERDLDVIVKMNPPMLGKERLEHLLYDVLGYTELTVNPSAYTSGLMYDEAIGLVDRLKGLAKSRGRSFGVKFSNTLEVLNHREFFHKDQKVQYLSGQPLHVITMQLTEVFRRDMGAEVPISFSAGVDKFNFANCVACGFVPASICTDLLRPGGYGRLPDYHRLLADAMKKVGARDVDAFILDAFGQREEATRRAASGGGTAVQWAALLNTSIAAKMALEDVRYRAEKNRKAPPRIERHLTTFDCITCDKCIPVCPNAANFTYPTPRVTFDYADVIVGAGGEVTHGPQRQFEIDKEAQIANFADWCNECGNCDTFCPEYGGPYIKKPGFHGTEASWRAAAPRDGFYVASGEGVATILGRMKGKAYALQHDRGAGVYRYSDGVVSLRLNAEDHGVRGVEWEEGRPAGGYQVDMNAYHTLRYLLAGIIDRKVVHQANTGA